MAEYKHPYEEHPKAHSDEREFSSSQEWSYNLLQQDVDSFLRLLTNRGGSSHNFGPYESMVEVLSEIVSWLADDVRDGLLETGPRGYNQDMANLHQEAVRLANYTHQFVSEEMDADESQG